MITWGRSKGKDNMQTDRENKKNQSVIAKNELGQKSVERKPRLLWANCYCLLDKSSGASISVNQILTQFVKNGFEVEILGATIFDNKSGSNHLSKQIEEAKKKSKLLEVKDKLLTHSLLVTESTSRMDMKLSETTEWYKNYVNKLNSFRPDCVFYYGGNPWDLLIPDEARMRKIPSVAYLVNANYQSARWCRDVDEIVTDTVATANFYKNSVGFAPKPIGKFIDPSNVIAEKHLRKHITFINPSWEKGAGIVAMLAIILEKKRPDIIFEIVQSRGDWGQVVKIVSTEIFNEERDALKNVIVTANTNRMAEVYSRSRVILGLSLWWESGSRVLAEAMLNGIPAIVSNFGGSPEMVGSGGVIVDLPEECHNEPFLTLPKVDRLQSIADLLEKLWDDESFYLNLMSKSLHQGMTLHQMNSSTKKLLNVFAPLIDKRAGDYDLSKIIHENHKQLKFKKRTT